MSSAVAVLGAGAWGTALAIQAARAAALRGGPAAGPTSDPAGRPAAGPAGAPTAGPAGGPIRLWARDPAQAAAIAASRSNARHLPGATLPPAVMVSADAAAVLEGAVIALLAVPVQHLRAVLRALPAGLPPLLICAKGVEAGTLQLPLEILAEERPSQPAGILSGPNFAHEVAAGLPAAAVIASLDPALRQAADALLATPAFRLYASEDPIGVQVGGAAKNVIAIAAGVVSGAGLGENARAALVTRGLAELARLVLALGGRAETAAGLSGLGDLLLTATGASSRNFSLGLALGQGLGLAAVLAGRQAVTEGVATAPALVARAAAAGVELPIAAAVAALLAGEVTVAEAMARLLARPRRDE